jgi:hypothetical protein
MNVENPRLRLVLGTNWQVLLVVLGVVALATFAGAATTYQDRPMETRSVDVDQQAVVTNTSHRARVVREDGLWPKGTALENKPVYIRNDTPAVRTTARTRVTGADTARIRHVWRLTISITRDGESFYAESRVLANESYDATSARTTATVDVEEVVRRVANVSERARGAGTVGVTLGLAVSYRTGAGYSGTETYSAPLALQGETYAIDGEMGGRTSHSSTARMQVAQPRDWGPILGMTLLGLVALAVAGVVVAADPSEIDVERARIDLHRTRYEDWISPGVIPMGISQQFVKLETIEDVVDVAIDTNERVVYDRRRDLYAVMSENVVYYFSTGGSWMESAFGPMQWGGDGAPGGTEEGPFGGGDFADPGSGPGGIPGGPPGGDDGGFGDGAPTDAPDEGTGGPFEGPDGDATNPFGTHQDDGPDGNVTDGDEEAGED